MLRAMNGRGHEHKVAEAETYRGHWAIFLPSLAVALLYGGAWLVLLAAGKSETALARLALLVVMLVVPLLAVIAGLRYRSIRVEIGRDTVAFRQGWLRPGWTRIRLSDIRDAGTQWSPIGRRIGGGALTLKVSDGTRYRIADIASPEIAAREINRRAATTGQKAADRR